VVKTTPIVKEEVYDVALLAPWELAKHANGGWQNCLGYSEWLRARLYIHPTFSWNQGLHEVTCWNQGHVLAVPFRGILDHCPKPGKPGYGTFKIEVLPFPFGGDVLPPDPSRTEVVWPSKDVFHKYWQTTDHKGVADLGISYLTALVRLCEKYPKAFSKVHFFTGKWNFNVKWAGRDDHRKLAEKLPDPQFHDWLLYNELLDIFSRSKFATVIAGFSSDTPNIVASGVLPTLVAGHPMSPVAEKLGIQLPGYDTSHQLLYEWLEGFMLDDSRYKDTVLEYQEFMGEHSIPRVIDRFWEIVETHLP